ncbi:DUF1592 domain-containing protein [Blastopirellula sp. JC732]|uniref:DUF1592 domain-containing protein n=1 Tax=Blastopirellula sediminis TaxID=2894196 RepID=A0A9X1MHW8_9BACT|nr:DUF1592 domain-containing protein [Blastopirellula sediminis]MCC9607943.1 DUF1592 domain-containing protein [Blastopirellula sediminis]MCC9627264.1 DUF1592 domain-containing protein [Blastopirellula sediminis]
MRSAPLSPASFIQRCYACWIAAVVLLATNQAALSADEFPPLAEQYESSVHALLKSYCLDCHSTDAKEGELDLERFADLAAIRKDPAPWQRVVEMVDHGEMPPEESKQMTPAERQQLLAWTRSYLDAEAKAGAGDPGPVLLRRLNNAEYAYTLHDLTGVAIDPTREFPVDGAAGEGFTNTGASLVMSPALFRKYLDAGQQIAQHAILIPEGFRFIEGTTRRDATNEIIAEIRQIYSRHTLDGSDPSILNRWNVADPGTSTQLDGRVDLDLYLTALVKHRDRLRAEPNAATVIAAEEKINPKYFAQIARLLLSDPTGSPLLDDLRKQVAAAGPEDGKQIAGVIRAWQTTLWKFNSVGHFGSIRPWQQAENALTASQEFRFPITSGEDSLLLTAGSVGQQNAVAVWRNPRFVRNGGRTIPLRDLRDIAAAHEQNRQAVSKDLAKYLAAAWEVKTTAESPDLQEIAAKRELDPILLSAWTRYLGIAPNQPVTIAEYLDLPLNNSAAIRGWGRGGLQDLSLIANSSDELLRIPGDIRPHTIAVHPRPERWVAVAWRSPVDGTFRIRSEAFDAHNACGNGFQWRLELRRPGERRVLAAADVDSGQAAEIPPIADLEMKQGEMLTLLIGPRNQEHTCDLTGIDLEVTSTADSGLNWSLSKDCADSIAAGNPQADQLGNADVWHFFTEPLDPSPSGSQVENPQIAQWRSAADAAKAHEIALAIQTHIESDSNADLYRALTSLDGPLLSSLPVEELLKVRRTATSEAGLPSERFLASGDLQSQAPETITITLPPNMLTDYAFTVTGTLADQSHAEGSVQMEVGTSPPSSGHLVPGGKIITVAESPGGKIITVAESPAAKRIATSLEEFRQNFPIAFCYPQIVPVDEVVTLVLYHREDEPLQRLMLSEAESDRLDQLWSELRFVSGDALISVAALEQLLEYATQDADPTVFQPVRQPILDNAAAYRQQLLDAEPGQIDALVDFAAKLYRRPLTAKEEAGIRTLYADLRNQEFDHDQAFRLSLGRLFASPAFLYRLETPQEGRESSPVSDRQLATRLSYFLWSSLPDDELNRLANTETLQDDAALRAQVERMRTDARSRRLAIEFACQWMHIRNFDQFDEKSEQTFPEFAELRGLMYEESAQFFSDLIQRDGSILEILDADHTFLNDRLAQHYGIPNVGGPEWRRVDGVRQYARGGVLGQATVLSMQAGASRTSPILRGNWISETLLGERLPRPPKNVPILPESAPAGLTERQLTEMHTTVAECAKCHARIDPYGFALESFDAIGRFRTKDTQGSPIVTDAVLVDGKQLAGYRDLRDYLAGDRRASFVRQFCRKLLGYSLGRSVRLSDEPLLETMEENLAQNDYRIGVALETIVLSRQFREIRDLQFEGVE